MEERVDVYDASRRRTGRVRRRGEAMKPGEYGLVVCVWVCDGAGHLLQPRQNLPDSGTCDERRLIGPLENLAVNNIAFINLGNVLGKAKMRVLLHINATAYRTLGAERVKEAPDAFNPVRRFRQTFRMHPHGG